MDNWSGKENDFLFTSVISKKISMSLVSSVVKEAALLAGLSGKFSSHSLRIGGATAAMMGGLSMEQIHSIGHWESEAVLLYQERQES